MLYWECGNQIIPGGSDIYDYFGSKGFEVIQRAHPSLLVCAMSQLTEKKLEEIGVPFGVDVVLPTDETSLLPGINGDLCFISAIRSGGRRLLGINKFKSRWLNVGFAFLLQKTTT